MPNLPYTPIQDGDEGDQNLWNTRFLAIHNLLNGGLDAFNLADNAVSSSKLASDSVTTIKIANNAVTSAKLAASEAWIPVTFQNSWTNYSIGVEFLPASYMKDVTGTVHMRGLVKSGTMSASMFTLPVGYRVDSDAHIASVSNGLFGNLRINRDGTVVPQAGSNIWFALDGIRFKAAQ